MATASYNVAQITNFDKKFQQLPSFIKNDIEYVQYNFNHSNDNDNDINKQIVKLGYCCETKGIGLTVYLYLAKNPNMAIPILIGKTGTFELQPEQYSKINEDGITEEIELKINIVKIDLPKNIKFVLDYAYIPQQNNN